MSILQAVIFDMDGVLVDTVPYHYRAWHRMFTEEGYYFDHKVYKEKVDGKPRLAGISSVAVKASKENQEKMAAKKQKYFLESVEKEPPEPFYDGINLITSLKKSGVRTAVASSSKNTEFILKKIGIYDLFDEIVSGHDFKKGKPAPEIFLTARDRLGVLSENCVVVEDAIEGVNAGLNAGIFTFGLARTGNGDDLKHASMVINTLEGLSKDKIENYMVEKHEIIRRKMVD